MIRHVHVATKPDSMCYDINSNCLFLVLGDVNSFTIYPPSPKINQLYAWNGSYGMI